jgi:hypothetical protein
MNAERKIRVSVDFLNRKKKFFTARPAPGRRKTA